MGTLFMDYLRPKPCSFHATTATLRLLASRVAEKRSFYQPHMLDGVFYPSLMLLHVACSIALPVLFSVIISLGDSIEETCAHFSFLGYNIQILESLSINSDRMLVQTPTPGRTDSVREHPKGVRVMNVLP